MVIFYEQEAEEFLKKHQFSVAKGIVATNKPELLRVIKELGLPVTLKIYSHKILHKSDVGGVKIDLRTKEEEKLMELYDTPVMVTHYPKDAMAFYKPKDPKNPKVALCFDMLAPEGYGELIGGSERDVDLKELEKAIKKNGENMETYKWYLDLRRYGSVPHAGFGMGVERLINWICGLDHIRDAIAFPRTMLRYTP